MPTAVPRIASPHEELVDITERVRAAVRETGIRDGLVALYVQGATAALMIQENWDASVPMDAPDHEDAEIDVGCIGLLLQDATGKVIGGLSVPP